MALLAGAVERGLTAIYVTHEPDVAQYASRVIVVRDGRIVSDTPQVAQRARLREPRAA